MPMTPDTVTAASRRTLPTYPAFAIVVGLVWALDPGSRIADSAGLRFAGRMTPAMGWIVFVIGILLAVAWATGFRPRPPQWNRRLYVLGLGALLTWLTVWAVVLVLAAVHGQATWAAWTWPAAIARFCWASQVSLEAREV